MSKSLKGKTAPVTGASRGLGRATAQDLAKVCAVVAISYASNDEATRERLVLIEAKGGQASLITTALGSLEAAQEVADFEDDILLGRIGEPSDLSGVALALASPLMGFVTGQVFEVSGGPFTRSNSTNTKQSPENSGGTR